MHRLFTLTRNKKLLHEVVSPNLQWTLSVKNLLAPIAEDELMGAEEIKLDGRLRQDSLLNTSKITRIIKEDLISLETTMRSKKGQYK